MKRVRRVREGFRAVTLFYILRGWKTISIKTSFSVVYFLVYRVCCTITIVNGHIYSRLSRWYSEYSGNVNPGRTFTMAAIV